MIFLSARQGLRPCRAVFRWSLTIGGIEIPHFSEPKISFAASGIGMGGISTSTLSVRTYHENIDLLDIPAGTEVQLTCETDSSIQIPPYYIKSRQADGKFISWTCSDGLYIIDAPVDFTDEDFKDDKISANSALSKAAHVCGFREIRYAGGAEKDLFSLLAIVGDIDRSIVEGKSARDIFSFFAESFCGSWTVSEYNDLIFSPFGLSYRAAWGVEKNTPIRRGGRKKYTKLIMSDGDKIFTAGSGSASATLMLSTPLASQELCHAIWLNIAEIEYRAWECDKGLTNKFIYPGYITFSGETDFRLCNNITMYPSAAGIFFSASANAAPETDYAYQSQVQRQLKRKLELDVRNGDTAYGKKGIKVFQNLNETADGRKKATVVTAFKSEV